MSVTQIYQVIAGRTPRYYVEELWVHCCNRRAKSEEFRRMNLIKHDFIVASRMLRDPRKTLEEIDSETILHAFLFLLTVGTVTALLTPLQVHLGFKDINGLHAGGQAEFLAKDVSAIFRLGVEWRPVLIEVFYFSILLLTSGYLHIILKAVGGKGSGDPALGEAKLEEEKHAVYLLI
jgi:hypothetical protein